MSIKRTIFDSISLAYLTGVITLFFVNSKESLPQLRFLALVTVALLLLGAFVSYVLNSKGIMTLGEHIFQPAHKKNVSASKRWYTTFWGLELLVLFISTCTIGALQTQFSFLELLDEAGFSGAQRMFSALFAPNFEILPLAVQAIIETIFIAFMATAIAIPFAFFLSFLCAKNIMKSHVVGFLSYASLRTILNVTRSVEPLIWAIIFSVWVGIGPFAGMLALMIHSIASLTKQYSEIVECVDEGPIEAIQATGASSLQVIWYAIVPQVILPYVSFTIYRWDINVRMATIIGLVGGGGIGTLLIQYQGQAMWNEVGCIIFVIAAVVWAMDTASAYIREALK